MPLLHGSVSSHVSASSQFQTPPSTSPSPFAFRLPSPFAFRLSPLPSPSHGRWRWRWLILAESRSPDQCSNLSNRGKAMCKATQRALWPVRSQHAARCVSAPPRSLYNLPTLFAVSPHPSTLPSGNLPLMIVIIVIPQLEGGFGEPTLRFCTTVSFPITTARASGKALPFLSPLSWNI